MWRYLLEGISIFFDVKRKYTFILGDSGTGKIKNGKSKYTIGEVRKILISRGYPCDLVERCIVDYLEDEYLV